MLQTIYTMDLTHELQGRIFHTKYPKIFRASLRNWKKYDFLA